MGKRKFKSLRPLVEKGKLKEIGSVLIGNGVDVKIYTNPSPDHEHDTHRANLRVLLDCGKPSTRMPVVTAIDANDLTLQGVEEALRKATISVVAARVKLASENENEHLLKKLEEYLDNIP